LEDNLASNKCTLDKVEEISVDIFSTEVYSINYKKACNR